MVIQNQVQTQIQDSFFEDKEIIKEMNKEIKTLIEIGVEEYEIKYLLALKKKREASLKWKDTT